MKTILTRGILSILLMFGVHASAVALSLTITNKNCPDNQFKVQAKGGDACQLPDADPGKIFKWYTINSGDTKTVQLSDVASCEYAVEARNEILGGYQYNPGSKVECKIKKAGQGCRCNFN